MCYSVHILKLKFRLANLDVTTRDEASVAIDVSQQNRVQLN